MRSRRTRVSASFRIGLIADTHGLLRPEAVGFLHGCDHIVHAGDIGRAQILPALAAIAPLTAIRGNVDSGDWARELPETARVTLAGITLHVVHDLAGLEIEPVAEGVSVVVSGHSHRPLLRQAAGVWYVNPGSAGPRRFKLPVAVADLQVEAARVTPRIVELAVGATGAAVVKRSG